MNEYNIDPHVRMLSISSELSHLAPRFWPVSHLPYYYFHMLKEQACFIQWSFYQSTTQPQISHCQ